MWIYCLFDVVVSRASVFELSGAKSTHHMVQVIRITVANFNLVVKMLLETLEIEVTELAILVV